MLVMMELRYPVPGRRDSPSTYIRYTISELGSVLPTEIRYRVSCRGGFPFHQIRYPISELDITDGKTIPGPWYRGWGVPHPPYLLCTLVTRKITGTLGRDSKLISSTTTRLQRPSNASSYGNLATRFLRKPPFSSCLTPLFWRKPVRKFVAGGVLS